jgi:hypothetical protein
MLTIVSTRTARLNLASLSQVPVVHQEEDAVALAADMEAEAAAVSVVEEVSVAPQVEEPLAISSTSLTFVPYPLMIR